ncbi:MAG: sugar transporter [Eubacterium sp.]|jgi:D-proline reductase (dithiol) PrdA
MSISEEYAKEHSGDPAVLCCRAEEGTVITSHNLEDPTIFPDLVDSGLLNIDGALTIGQVLGATLTKTEDSLTALTPDNLKDYSEGGADEEEAAEDETSETTEAPAPAALSGATVSAAVTGGMMKIHIGEGKDIDLEVPTWVFGGEAPADR